MECEQIKKALECCTSCDKSADCPIGCPYGDINSCEESLMYHSLALIKELTKENEAWQKQLISTEEKADKAYYDLACEVENLRAENEKLAHSCTELTQNLHTVQADTVNKMYSEIKGRCIKGGIYPAFVASTITRVAEELLEGKNEN